MQGFGKGSRKLMLFGALGACGCFVGALLGELLLLVSRSEPRAQAVSLLIDCSGSMGGDDGGVYSKLAEVKRAAAGYVEGQKLPPNELAVVGFGSGIHTTSPLSNDASQIKAAIDILQDGGSTDMASGLLAAKTQLADSQLACNILLFTDGEPDSQPETLNAAETCRNSGVRILAIGTGDADLVFLGRVTGDPRLVFSVKSGDFESGFARASSAIETASGDRSFLGALILVAIWTSILGISLSLALIMGQNWYLRNKFLSQSQGATGSIGGALAGVAAGAVGQIAFSPMSYLSAVRGFERLALWILLGAILGLAASFLIKRLSANRPKVVIFSSIGLGVVALLVPAHWVNLIGFGRILAWGLLGGLTGRGMAFFVPNLDPRRAAKAGAVGGALGALAFLFAAANWSDFLGRLVGTSVLGFAIGLMVAFVELAYRERWLEINYGGNDVVDVTLGGSPVLVGGDRHECTVYVEEAGKEMLRYSVDGGEIRCERISPEGGSSEATVTAGDEVRFGDVVVTVRTS